MDQNTRKIDDGTTATMGDAPIVVVKSQSMLKIMDFKEIWEYRDLLFFLVWRNVKVMYAQTILGLSWALLNPLIQIVIFTIVFGRVAKLNTGGIPYTLFSSVAIVPWTYMSSTMSASSQSLVAGQGMLGKVYFPRLIYPLAPVLSKLVDFSISVLLLIAIALYYGVKPTVNLVYLPVFIVMMIMVPLAIGLWLSSLAVRYRDVNFAMPFIISMLMYTAPILYSADAIPEAYRLLYSFNPIVGVIEGFRACLLGDAMPWMYIAPGFVTGILVLITGAIYFKRMERIIVDVI